MRNPIGSLWAEPRPGSPPKLIGRDFALAGILLTSALAEAVLRDDVMHRNRSLILTLVLIIPLFWRRTHPLRAMAASFLIHIPMHLGTGEVDSGSSGSVGLYTMAFVLIFPYAVVRWGSGREAIYGVLLAIAMGLFGLWADNAGLGDAIGGMLVVLFPAELGGLVRYQHSSRERRIDEARMLEREQLARELHDSVAHHVSAIAIQAQAGIAVARTDPEAAERSLAIIEESASRTLTEMRSMVGALRTGPQADLSPQQGVASLRELAATASTQVPVDVELSGDLMDLQPPVDAAIYRVAQESITNALRHALNATRISVSAHGGTDTIELIVRDDGARRPFDADTGLGYGLIGMAERAKLLGGSLTAGPERNGGWTVTASFPRTPGAAKAIVIGAGPDSAALGAAPVASTSP